MRSSSPAAETSAPRLRTVLVGLGRIGFGYHGPALRGQRGFELVAAVDPAEERRAEASAAWQVSTHATLEDALAAHRPELVVIASPTSFHAAQARAAFAAGAHVFCDKPVATSLAELDAMLAAGARAGQRFLAYQPARFKPEVAALREVLASGRLGRIHLIKRVRADFVRRSDWQAQRAHGGGLLNNYGSHCLDEILSLLPNEPIERVWCATRTVASVGDAEDVVKATLTGASGVLLDFDISQASALAGPPWEVRGSCGSALYEAASRTWRLRYFDPAEAPVPAPQAGLAAANRSYNPESLPWHEASVVVPAQSEVDYYERAWKWFARGDSPPVSADESRRLLELIERCRRSSETGHGA